MRGRRCSQLPAVRLHRSASPTVRAGHDAKLSRILLAVHLGYQPGLLLVPVSFDLQASVEYFVNPTNFDRMRLPTSAVVTTMRNGMLFVGQMCRMNASTVLALEMPDSSGARMMLKRASLQGVEIGPDVRDMDTQPARSRDPR